MLELAGIEARYGAATALREVSLTIGDGEIVCVVGPNGAGKTTLVGVVAGLVPATAGTMRFDGRDMTRVAPHRFCGAGIALVPEGRRLFTGMTVRENLALGAYRAGARAERNASLERICAMFPALVPKLDRPAGSLSGGQQQMVAIGRALMAQPKLLLLDEPSLGLSPAIVLELFRIVRAINDAGVAVLLVEQNVAMALEAAARAYVLEEGRIAIEGPAQALRELPHIRRAYLGTGLDAP